MANPKDFLTQKEQQEVVESIQKAELETSGEIRLHIESKCGKKNVLDRASEVFADLKMHKTELRNGVLFYLSIKDRKFAILGDAGINQKVPDNFWDDIKEAVLKAFSEKEYGKGLSTGIEMAGEQLKRYFPRQSNDKNELSDDISFGEEENDDK